MIKSNLQRNIWINSALLIVFLLSLVKLGLQIKYMTLGKQAYFGYENTLEWDISVSLFWMFWIVGSLGLMLKRRWSFVFLFPSSALSVLVCTVTFQRALYKSVDVQIMTYGGLILSMALLFYINWPSVRKEIGLSIRSYVLGTVFFVAFIVLFLVIDQKWKPSGRRCVVKFMMIIKGYVV